MITAKIVKEDLPAGRQIQTGRLNSSELRKLTGRHVSRNKLKKGAEQGALMRSKRGSMSWRDR